TASATLRKAGERSSKVLVQVCGRRAVDDLSVIVGDSCCGGPHADCDWRSLAFFTDPLKQSLSFQLVEQPFVDILLQVYLRLGSGASLGNHFQDDAHAFVGYARRKGEERSIKLIALLRERRIFLLQPLVGNRQGFLLIGDELVDALAVSLQ